MSSSDPNTFTSHRLRYVDDITFSECAFVPSSVRINTKRVYVRYTKENGQVRFSSANFIHNKGICLFFTSFVDVYRLLKHETKQTTDAPEDLCELNKCSIHAECIMDAEAPEGYLCVCRLGYDGNGFNCYGKRSDSSLLVFLSFFLSF